MPDYYLQVAKQKNIDLVELKLLANRGSMIAFNQNLDKLILLSEQEGFSAKEIFGLISTCADGGMLEKELKAENQ